MKIAILTGGTSSEREIALKSAEMVIELLGSSEVRRYDFPNELDRFLSERDEIDVVIPVFHGRGGEDGTIQGFLETLNLPYVFSSVAAHALAMDKAKTKLVVSAVGVKTPASRVIRRGDVVSFEGPVAIKPMDGGSSVGVSIAHDSESFARGIAEGLTHGESVLVESFIQGDEFTVAIIEEEGKSLALPVVQIKSKNAFFDVESKYDPALAEEICPALISEDLRNRLQDAALLAHRSVGARHVSRSDFIVDRDEAVWFLEINTIPGMTSASLLPKAISAAQKDFGTVLRGWIDSVARN
jgi:D-alanine-D-alanine ligase